MVLASSQRIIAAAALSTLINAPCAFAIAAGWETFGPEARSILARAAPAAPHWVVYGVQWTSGIDRPPDASAVEGFDVFALGFLHVYGASDKAQEWTTLDATERTAVKAQYAAAGIKLVMSAFGPHDAPTSDGADPVFTANTFAAWVKEYDLDGIDVDYEDLPAFSLGTGAAEQWLISFTTQLRSQLPADQYIITHAPLAPLFSPHRWYGGGYLRVDSAVGSLIDWYNVKFYDQGPAEYTTCAGLLETSSAVWPKTALFEIADAGIPLSKLVIGKPARRELVNDGYMSPETLAGCVAEAKDWGWDGGVAAWDFPDADADWIADVRAGSWPV